jgi:diguanylate cyclase (GGDEF)-like protein
VRVWWSWLTVATLICVGYLFLPADSAASTVVSNGLGVLSFLMILAGMRRHRPAAMRAWSLFAAGVIMFVAGDITYELSGLVLGHHPFPYFDDAAYFAAYPLLWSGLLLTARGRGRRDAASLIDAAVIATGVGLVYWIFVIGPALADTSSPIFDRLVTVGYPTCDVLMCAVLTRLLSRVGGRTASLLLLAAGAAVNLICDVIWTVTSAFAADAGAGVNAGFMFGYVLWAAAALHPSMSRPGGPSRATAPRFGRGRFVRLAGCALVVPGMLFAEGARHDRITWTSIGVGAVLLSLLVLARMGGFVGQVQVQSAQLEVLAMHDELTGLPNRRRFEQRLAEVVGSGPAQVCLLDLNGFKVINDRFGHAVGDRLLVAVAERLTGLLRDADLVARMGGDEFAVLLTGATDPVGDAVVARVGAEMRRPLEVGTHELLIGASIGISGADGTSDPVEVQRRADVAMYAAKAGGDGFRRYVAELDDEAGEEARLGAEMRTALDTGPVPPGLPAHREPARRPHPVRRVAGPLAAPGPRVRQPGRLHPGGRAQRPDRRARRVDLADGVRAFRRLAGRARRRGAGTDLGERLGPAVGRARLRPGGRRRAGRDRDDPGAADRRGHRDRGLRRRRGRAGGRGHPRPRGGYRAGRLRHRPRRWACCRPSRSTFSRSTSRSSTT